MQTLNFKIEENELILEKRENLTSGGVKTVRCFFNFNEEWNKLTKTIVFISVFGETYNTEILNNECYIPSEILENKGCIGIGVYGTELENNELIRRYTTNLTYIDVTEGSYKVGKEPEVPTPDIWDLYLEEVKRLVEEAKSVGLPIRRITRADIN